MGMCGLEKWVIMVWEGDVRRFVVGCDRMGALRIVCWDGIDVVCW